MLNKISKSMIFNDNYLWLNTFHHFSFARYFNPKRMNFGKIRVINNDFISPNSGFDTHPHENMEIITYVINGKLTHKDSLGNEGTITRGEIQYMSAGTGIYHSEHNLNDSPLHLYQIWILPDKNGYSPNYGESHFPWEKRIDKLFHMVSSHSGNGEIKINSDVNIYSIFTNKSFNFNISINRQVYLIMLEGSSVINNIDLEESESLEAIEETIEINPKTMSHILIFEMKKGE